MVKRRLVETVAARLRAAPAVVLLGPRQVGKTTLARAIADARGNAAVYLDLERSADLRRLEDPDRFLRAQGRRLVVVDEVHRAPGLFPILRGIIDDRRRRGDRAGHFLLLGSASMDLMHQAGESLAGRVSYLELRPVDPTEYGADPEAIERLWTRGGFPEGLLAPDDAASLEWRRDFIRSYLERDVPMFAPRLPSTTVARCWGMLAHGQGTLLNQSRLAASLGLSAPAVGRYVDLLADLLLVRRLQPWSGNVGKRLIRSPKVYLRDSGLLHALLELESAHAVLGHPVAGASWEGFVVESLIAAAGDRYVPTFYRTADGAEADLVLERGGRVRMAIEVKRTSAPSLSRGFRSACEVLRPKEAFVVHGGDMAWPMATGVEAISLVSLATRLLKDR